MLHLPAPSPYAFALSALDVLFTKEELSSSLLFESKKSKKPPLDHRKVQILLSKYTFILCCELCTYLSSCIRTHGQTIW